MGDDSGSLSERVWSKPYEALRWSVLGSASFTWLLASNLDRMSSVAAEDIPALFVLIGIGPGLLLFCCGWFVWLERHRGKAGSSDITGRLARATSRERWLERLTPVEPIVYLAPFE